MKQYKRNYELLIDKDGFRRIIKELRIKFEITKSIRSYPNIAKIDIYNPSDETLSFLDSRLTKITLNAGYGSVLNLIFIGRIRNTLQTRQGVDTIVTIYSADGQKDWEQSIFNKTLTETVNIKQVVKELIGTFTETSIGELLGLEAEADKIKGQTLSGNTRDILDMLGEDYGFEWSIQNNTFSTIPQKDIIKPDDIIRITSTTGMIGSPTITEIGVDVKTLLNSNLSPNRGFAIESISQNISIGNLNFRNLKKTKAEGLYKIFEVLHKGDTHDGEWVSLVKGVSSNAIS